MPERSLTIGKEVAGEGADQAKTFTFTVTLKDAAGNALTGGFKTVKSDNTKGEISSGGTVTLKHNETITINDLPVGTKWSVTETADTAYSAEVSVNNEKVALAQGDAITGSGEIAEDEAEQVAFVNTVIPPEPPKTGTLTITKTVEGGGDAKKDFAFTVELTGADGNALDGSYKTDGPNGAQGEIASGDVIYLRHGDTVTVFDLPAGANWRVTEAAEEGYEAAAYADGAKTEPAGDGSASASGVIAEGKTAQAAFVNTFVYQTIDLPMTGDRMPVALMAALALVCGAALLTDGKRRDK